MKEPDSEYTERNHTSRNIIIALVLLIVFILFLILFLYLLGRPALFGSFAYNEGEGITSSTPTTSVQNLSQDNSYLFASPLRAAVAAERVRITAYVLDSQGMGISGRQVTLGNDNMALHVFPITPSTDEYGRATFDISSDQAGLFTIEASVNGVKLSQRVNVTFE